MSILLFHCNESTYKLFKLNTIVFIFFRWLGINDINSEGNWVYDSSNQPIAFSKWNEGEPNSAGNEDCAEHRVVKGGWNDNNCWSKNPVVFEY